ncbi:hypothetical protein NDU88_005420 [Pleurodeles waltl]|uniref:Uncharacterized protein n=1 Tax=Pleurodeles waltl TaxID=8319 RepID=A0AAV7L175_PLEWA|nr:hypothetical protein NDU88_005420 [Pleurodeles waltl]
MTAPPPQQVSAKMRLDGPLALSAKILRCRHRLTGPAVATTAAATRRRCCFCRPQQEAHSRGVRQDPQNKPPIGGGHQPTASTSPPPPPQQAVAHPWGTNTHPPPSGGVRSSPSRPRGGAEHQCSSARPGRRRQRQQFNTRGACGPTNQPMWPPGFHNQWSPWRCLEAAGPKAGRERRGGGGRTTPPTAGAPLLQATPAQIQWGQRQAQLHPFELCAVHRASRGTPCTPGLRHSPPFHCTRGQPLPTPASGPGRRNAG